MKFILKIFSFVFITPFFLLNIANAKSIKSDTEEWIITVNGGNVEWIKESGEPPGPEFFAESGMGSVVFTATETMYRNSKTSGTVISYRSDCIPSNMKDCDCTWTGTIFNDKANGTVQCAGDPTRYDWYASIINNTSLAQATKLTGQKP